MINKKTPAPTHAERVRSLQIRSLLYVFLICIALFGVSWLFRGEPPLRAAFMSAALLLVMLVMRLIEPWARKMVNAKRDAERQESAR